LLIAGELTADLASPPCWLCGRPLGRKVERHHPVPKSRGGRATVAVHPICHRALHAIYSNAELERLPLDGLRTRPELQRFLRWVTSKRPDFHAPTARPRRTK